MQFLIVRWLQLNRFWWCQCRRSKHSSLGVLFGNLISRILESHCDGNDGNSERICHARLFSPYGERPFREIFSASSCYGASSHNSIPFSIRRFFLWSTSGRITIWCIEPCYRNSDVCVWRAYSWNKLGMVLSRGFVMNKLMIWIIHVVHWSCSECPSELFEFKTYQLVWFNNLSSQVLLTF